VSCSTAAIAGETKNRNIAKPMLKNIALIVMTKQIKNENLAIEYV
jgi:hypothetical protein